MKQTVILLFLALLSFSSCSKDKDLDTPTQKEATTEHQEMLKEINFLRTNPQGYAEQRLKPYYDKRDDNGAYNDVKNTKAVQSLKLNTKLIASAEHYADVLAKKNKLSHSFGGSLGDRLKSFDYNWMGCGENIAYGSYPYLNVEKDAKETAIRYVLMYVIDKNVKGVGHRKNLLNPSWKEVGVGFSKNSSNFFNAQQFGSGEMNAQ